MLRCVLEEFLQTCDPFDRRLLRLSQQSRLDPTAIAARVGGTPATVHDRQRRLRRKLDTWMEQHHGDGTTASALPS